MRPKTAYRLLWAMTLAWMTFFVGYLVNIWLTAFRQRQWLGSMSEARQTELQFLLTGGLMIGGVGGVLFVQKSKRLACILWASYFLLLVAYVLWW